MQTETLPGSEDRIRVYATRAGQKKTIHEEEDLDEDDRRGHLLTRRPNGIVQVKNETRLTDVSLPKGLPAKIRVLRKICGYSQRQLATEISVSRLAVQFWEYGLRVPSLKSLHLLARALRVTVGRLCGDAEDMPN